jgi:pimeloyl-ACP methyl ester carboxylesterase
MKTTRLSFDQSAINNAQSILFLHGGGSSAWSWQPVIHLLQNSFHCIAADLPDHGRSVAVTPFSMDLAADEVAALIESQAHGGQAVVVGLSEGAQVGVALLARHPRLVTHAVLSGALLRPLVGARMLTPALLRWSYNWFVKPFRKTDWYIRWNMRASVGIPAEYFEQFKADFQLITAEGWTNLMLANQAFRLPGGLEKVQARVLALAGEQEYGVMHVSARDLAAALPAGQAGLVRLPGSASLAQSHNWPLNAPELCAAVIRAWVLGLDLPAEVWRL